MYLGIIFPCFAFIGFHLRCYRCSRIELSLQAVRLFGENPHRILIVCLVWHRSIKAGLKALDEMNFSSSLMKFR